MDAAYFKAAIPDPYIIFGVRLLPLSIGRYRVLKRFGCNFVSDSEVNATFEDLALGIIVCSMRVKEFFELVESGEFPTEAKRLGERIRAEVRHDPQFNLLSKFGLFQAYIADSSQCPKYWDESPSDEPKSAAHWSHNIEIALREIGYTSEDIEEGPLSKALFDFFKHAENHGSIRLMTDEEHEQGEANEKIFAQLAAQMKGGTCQGLN